MESNSNLTANQLKALELLITEGKSQKETADALNITEATIWNWLNKPAYEAFQRAYQERLDAATTEGLKRLQTLVGRSVAKIEEIAFGQWDASRTGQANTRLKAVVEILDRVGLPKISREEHTGKDGKELPVLGFDVVMPEKHGE